MFGWFDESNGHVDKEQNKRLFAQISCAQIGVDAGRFRVVQSVSRKGPHNGIFHLVSVMTSAGKRRAYILASPKCATGSLGVVVHCGLLIYASGLAAGDYMPTTMIRSCQRSREWISSRRYGKPGEILPHANRAAHLSKVAGKRGSSRLSLSGSGLHRNWSRSVQGTDS